MPHLFTGRRLLILAVLAAAAFLAYHFIPHGGRGPRPEMTSPVRTAKALAQDVPHYLQGLGTVQPYSDVLVTSRVSGPAIFWPKLTHGPTRQPSRRRRARLPRTARNSPTPVPTGTATPVS